MFWKWNVGMCLERECVEFVIAGSYGVKFYDFTQILKILYQTQKTLHQTFRILHQIIKNLHQTQKTLRQTFEILH